MSQHETSKPIKDKQPFHYETFNKKDKWRAIMTLIDSGNNSNKDIKSRLEIAMNYSYDNLIGDSRQMKQISDSVRKLAPTDINLLIQGEYGVGKEHVAKIIHYHSFRYKNQLEILDCNILSDDLIDKEFFDFNNPNNLVMKTNFGTLLILNIDKMSVSVQKKIEELLTGKLSMNYNLDRIDIRLLSTSENDLEQLAQKGKFSPQLLRIIGEMKLNVPSLKLRKDDIELLFEYFIVRECVISGKPIMFFTADALDMLINHKWDENIHELKNIVRRAVKISKNNIIDNKSIIFIKDKIEEEEIETETVSFEDKKFGMSLDEGQRKLIVKTLNDNNWNFSRTARELGIGRTTLWRKVKKYELKEESNA